MADHVQAEAAGSIMRVIHVQNAEWAKRFLLKKFNLLSRDDLVGSDFGRYLHSNPVQAKGGKPMLGGRIWKTQHDPWRKITKTAFSIDYYKPYAVDESDHRTTADLIGKVMELNCYDDDGNPTYGYDVFAQRLVGYFLKLWIYLTLAQPVIRAFTCNNERRAPRSRAPTIRTSRIHTRKTSPTIMVQTNTSRVSIPWIMGTR
jgi:hypothetical protein